MIPGTAFGHWNLADETTTLKKKYAYRIFFSVNSQGLSTILRPGEYGVKGVRGNQGSWQKSLR
jgi:hypothetical protein